LTERGEEEGYPIPATMPPRLAAKREYQHHIEDIGEPTTACHMVKMNIDPKHWLDSLLSNIHQNLTTTIKGGCLKSMMAFEDSGTLSSRPSILGMIMCSTCRRTLWIPCRETSSWMAKYGK